MRIGPQPGVGRATYPPRQVAPERTKVSRAELRAALGRALERSDGHRPAAGLVDVLTAHASLETASGDRMYNFNFGGIKGVSPSGSTAVCRTREVLAGKEVVVHDGFRAYASLDEGALDYVRTMKTQFSAAVAAASRGDVAGFASALKSAHYYTASEADYAHGLGSLMGASSGKAVSESTASASSALGLSSAGLARVSDTLDAERWVAALPTTLSPSASRAHHADEDEDDS